MTQLLKIVLIRNTEGIKINTDVINHLSLISLAFLSVSNNCLFKLLNSASCLSFCCESFLNCSFSLCNCSVILFSMLISFVSLVYYIVPIALIICFPILLIKEIIPYLIFKVLKTTYIYIIPYNKK